jgi:hypothetical protein
MHNPQEIEERENRYFGITGFQEAAHSEAHNLQEQEAFHADFERIEEAASKLFGSMDAILDGTSIREFVKLWQNTHFDTSHTTGGIDGNPAPF